MAKDILYTKILDDEASFQLIRTNPKLTGNVKLTVNQNGDMWLNSIDANDELAKDQYKRVAIDPNKSLPSNLFKFFNNGQTPNEIVFALNEKVDTSKTSKDFKDQFDFSNYFSGVKYLPSKRYEERLSYFAPIYLKKDIPEYFIILKITDPINKNIGELKYEYPYDSEQYLKEVFKKATIIKTFNIGPTSKIGKYLRNYINDPSFPTASLNVSFEKDTYTNWNGILFNSGVFGSRGEILNSLYKTSYPLKFFEENITLGFQRNGVIYPNIINLEFIFDDETSSNYEFNRYLGVYVNAIQLSKLNIDLNRAYAERKTWENTPRLRRKYAQYEETTLIQENKDGVIFPFYNAEVLMSDFENIFSDKDNFYFNFINDKEGNIYLPKLDSPFTVDYDTLSNELYSGKIRLSNTEVDFGKFFGPNQLFLQDKGFASTDRGFCFQYLKLKTQLSHIDTVKFYHPHGTKVDGYGKYDEFIGTENYNVAPNPGDYYFYHDIDNVVGHDTFYFNAKGTLTEVASAISGCINNVRTRSFKSYQYKETIIVRCSVAGDHDSKYSLEFYSPSNQYSSIVIGDIENSSLISKKIQFEGGSFSNKNRLVINYGHKEKIELNFKDILVKGVDTWSPIFKISKYVDLITEENFTSESSAKNAIDSMFNNLVVALEVDEIPSTTYGDFVMRLRTLPKFGLLSFFPIKDFDFDFYSSQYANFPKIDLYKYYFIPENIKLLKPNYPYLVRGAGSITINELGTEYLAGTYFTLPPSTENYSYSVNSKDAFVSFTDDITSFGADLTIPINDENKELEDFTGFFLLKDPDRVVEDSENRDFHLKQKYLNGITNSEYDFYKENYSKDFAVKSKMIPYITKWGIKEGTDVRNNPYRLNTELVFGFNNFSPNHEDRTQNPANFTHEWFYIESKFEYLDTKETVKDNEYYFNEKFDLNLALTDPNYFINYFSYTPTFGGKEVAPTQSRYAPILKNKIGEYETLFKGFRLIFRDVIDVNTISENGKPVFNPNSTRFEGYQFSVLLKPTEEKINDDKTAPIKYRFIEHKTFKFILLLIEVNLGSIAEIDNIWKTVSNFSPELNLVTTLPSGGNFLDPSYTTDKLYNTINGEYRISFDVNSISDLTYTLLYSLKNKKYNNLLNAFSNIKLSSKVNLTPSGAFIFPNTIEQILNSNIANYPSKLSDEIINPNSSSLLIARSNLLNADFFMDYEILLAPQYTNKIIGATENSILTDTQNVILIDDTGSLSSTIPLGVPLTFISNYYTFKILTGGESYYEKLIEKLSFAAFKKYVNELNPFIEYQSYEYSNTLTPVSVPKMYIEVPLYRNIEKSDAVITKVDSDKPSNFSFNSVIGFAYERSALDNTYEINRYDGGHEPIFKEVSRFMSTFKFTSNDISELELSNTKFNLDTEDFMQLKNFSHIKISDVKILDLESDDVYNPTYEALGEIAIGRENYFLLLSNWDYGFHYKYSNKTTYSTVPGTLRVEEDDSFIGKLVIVPKVIELEQFKLLTLSESEKLDDVDLSKIEVVIKETSSTVDGYINLNNALTSYLISKGFSQKFNEFLVNSTEFIGKYESIEDYVKDYIALNILKLYDISQVEFYTRKNPTLLTLRTINTEILNGIEFQFLDDKNRLEGGYKLSKNLKINKFDRLILKFSFNKELNGGLQISPKIIINFI